MDSNKLGVKIVRINQGYTDLLEINGDQKWTKNVWDIREDLKTIDNLDGSSAVLMLTSVDTGHILTVGSLIEGRTNDCISAWVYVPASINISGKELVEIVDLVKKEILVNERNDERLTQLFSKIYESAPATKIMSKSTGKKCAFRYYGQGAKYTLSELLKDMCQSYYRNYKSVFLLDNSSNLKCISGDNLSDKKVYSMVIVDPPGEVNSFVPYIEGERFVRQIYGVEGEIIKIKWQRSGYLPIETETTISQDIKFSIPKSDQFIRVIPFNTIRVVDKWGQLINEYKLSVAGKSIQSGQPITISESVINNVRVEIFAEGYERKNENVNLSLNQHVTIKMAKEIYSYKFILPSTNAEDECTIDISSNREIKNSPIKGYVIEGGCVTRNGKNYLIFKPFGRKFWIICLVCSIMVLLLGICGGYALNYFIEGTVDSDSEKVVKLNQENVNLKNRIKDLESCINSNVSSDTAIHGHDDLLKIAIWYLDNHKKWKREEMELLEPLRGLWDALNYRDFQKILQYQDLKESEKFLKLVKAIKENEKPFSGSYCGDKDTEITISRYIGTLGKIQNGTPKQNNGNEQSEQKKW